MSLYPVHIGCKLHKKRQTIVTASGQSSFTSRKDGSEVNENWTENQIENSCRFMLHYWQVYM
uniref:Uncharacterized protein n=1 Tax=Rhizophora mucronata TaxID=61149 RepID=A0A2P2NFS5_RHIMU